ncbi:MAG: helix-turn-helix domain-containing protein [bacterium]
MKNYREYFCQNLKAFRETKGLSQRQLSLQCGFAHSYVGQLERGKKDPSFESLVQMAEVLDVSIIDFFRDHQDQVADDIRDAILSATGAAEDILQSLSILSVKVESDLRMAGIWDAHGHILDFNRTVVEILEESEEELVGTEVWELSVFGDRDENRQWIKNKIEQIQDQPKIYRTRMELKPEPNQEIPTEVTLTPLTINGTEDYFILCEGHRLDDIEDS